MKIGVTGGNGFIGTHITSALLADGVEVVVLDHHKHRSSFGDERIERFYADVRDAVAVTEFAAHVDGIIHLAAVLGTQETISNPKPSVETNLMGSLNVFEAALQYDLPVVYAGVGNHWMRDQGAGTYTITKTAVEDLARSINKFRGGRISIVRPVNAYGPGQSVAAPYGSSKVRKIMPSFVCRALLGHDIEVYGGGVQTSDCVYVEDVAKVFIEALWWTRAHGGFDGTFEVGPETAGPSVYDIADMVRKHVYGQYGVLSDIKNLPMRPGEVPGAVVTADLTTTKEILGISPRDFVSLEDGIARTVDYFAERWLPTYEEQR